jgi:NADH-quinone oxidoreductase subunit C
MDDDKTTPPPEGPAPDAKPKPAAPAPPAAKKPDVDEEALRAPVPSRSLDRLKEVLPEVIEEVAFHCGVPIVRVKPERIVEVARFLRDDPGCRMAHLGDLCGMDLIGLGRPAPRFDVVYQLFSVEHRERIRLKAAVEEGGEIATVSGVWRTANWHEREAYDMFGIRFAGHPDPRRILMPEDYDAFPLRKDFPLEGREKDHGCWRKPEDVERGVVDR